MPLFKRRDVLDLLERPMPHRERQFNQLLERTPSEDHDDLRRVWNCLSDIVGWTLLRVGVAEAVKQRYLFFVSHLLLVGPIIIFVGYSTFTLWFFAFVNIFLFYKAESARQDLRRLDAHQPDAKDYDLTNADLKKLGAALDALHYDESPRT